MREEPGEVLLIPGLYGSGPEHWQSLWEREFGFARLAQADWETPRCVDWVAALDEAVARGPQGVVLVAHSLGSILVAHWAAFAEPAMPYARSRGRCWWRRATRSVQAFRPGQPAFRRSLWRRCRFAVWWWPVQMIATPAWIVRSCCPPAGAASLWMWAVAGTSRRWMDSGQWADGLKLLGKLRDEP